MSVNRAFLAAIVIVTIYAFVFRSVDLGNRPMHGDEAVHAEKFRDLWEKGVYRYDSNEYHGPTIYYAALPSVILHGRQNWPDTREADYRLPIAVFGAVMILLLLPLASSLGRASTLAAAVLIAISPAFVFYSRYFIQEVPFVFFTLALIACGWRFVQTRRMGWLALTGMSAGMMIATKETAVLSLFAMAVSIVLTLVWARWIDGPHNDNQLSRLKSLATPRSVSIATVLTLLTACLFISGFGTNIHGPIDYIRAYGPWLHRAQGASIHNHPFGYYLKLLIWSRIQVGKTTGGVYTEALIVVLAAAGALAALQPRARRGTLGGSVLLWRFIALYTVVLTLIYSVIPYKTPWCLLSFLLGMCMLAGLAVNELLAVLHSVKMKALAAVPLLLAAVQLNNQAYRASFVAYADPHNPYVYAATAAKVVDFQKRLDDLAKYWPEHNNMVIKVFSTSNYYWPLPWYLRRYPRVGWYSHTPATKDEAAAPVTACASEMDDQMSGLLDDTDLMNGIDEVRNGVFYETFIRMDVWTTYLSGKNGGVIKRIAPPPPAE